MSQKAKIFVLILSFNFYSIAWAESECSGYCLWNQEANVTPVETVCGGGGSSCNLAHMTTKERFIATMRADSFGRRDVFNDLENSTNPDVSLKRYLEIEKDYASRGEPLNADNVILLMHHLYKTPDSKCGFDSMSKDKGSYGLVCENGGKKVEFPGLTATLLKDKFPAYSKEAVVVETTPAPVDVVVGEVLPAEEDINIANSLMTSTESDEQALLPASVTDGVYFSDKEPVLPNKKRNPTSIGVR